MIREKVHKVSELMRRPTAGLGKWSRFLINQLKMWGLCGKLLSRNRASQQAAALAYHSMFGIIPLAIVMLVLVQSFPSSANVGVKLRKYAYENLNLTEFTYPNPDNPEESVQLTSEFDKYIDRFFKQANKGTAATLSILFVAWAAMKLLMTIEQTFNSIWNVMYGRSFLKRVFNYWTTLTLGPLLITGGITAGTVYALNEKFLSSWLQMLQPLAPFLITVLLLFLLYWSIPNTKVNPWAALWGAFVAALIWMVVKYLFAWYLSTKPFEQLYGAMALIPLTVLWIFLTWKIVLFGVQLSFVTQNFKRLDKAEIEAAQKDENFYIANEITVINIMRYVSNAFETGNAPVQASDVYRAMNLPTKFTRTILEKLVNEELLFITSEPKEGFVPGKEPGNVMLSDIAKTISAKSLGRREIMPDDKLDRITSTYKKDLEQYSLRDVLPKNMTEEPAEKVELPESDGYETT